MKDQLLNALTDAKQAWLNAVEAEEELGRRHPNEFQIGTAAMRRRNTLRAYRHARTNYERAK